VDVGLDDLLQRAGAGGGGARREGELSRATEWLETELAAGPVGSEDLKERARGEGISGITLRRAGDELGVRKRRTSAGPWTWELDSSDREGDQAQPTEHVDQVEQVDHLEKGSGTPASPIKEGQVDHVDQVAHVDQGSSGDQLPKGGSEAGAALFTDQLNPSYLEGH
jgi:hypothetical protein